MLPHPTPQAMRIYVAEEISAAAREWEAETGQQFPAITIQSAAKRGFDRCIAEHEAAKEAVV